MYVATNNGYLHHAMLSSAEGVRWTEIIQTVEKAPIICMDVMTMYSDFSLDQEDLVALGDGRGNVNIICLTNGDIEPNIILSFTWQAEKDRQLLGLHWCKSLECRFVDSLIFLCLNSSDTSLIIVLIICFFFSLLQLHFHC
jgi:WD repeat-containing protein 6